MSNYGEILSQPGIVGSNILPSSMYIEGKEVSLGTIVHRSWMDSGLTITEWNHLPDLDREALLAKTIYEMKAVSLGYRNKK